jgi:hypothetical protein
MDSMAKTKAVQLLISIVVMIFLTNGSAMVYAQNTSLDGLQVNKRVTGGFIPLDRAREESLRQFNQLQINSFFTLLQQEIQSEFGGTVRNFQIEFMTEHDTFILRGANQEGNLSLYLLTRFCSKFQQNELIDQSAAISGPNLSLPGKSAMAFLSPVQDWAGQEVQSGAMLLQFQVEFISGPKIVIVAGTHRWRPPSTHLCTVIILIIRFPFPF